MISVFVPMRVVPSNYHPINCRPLAGRPIAGTSQPAPSLDHARGDPATDCGSASAGPGPDPDPANPLPSEAEAAVCHPAAGGRLGGGPRHRPLGSSVCMCRHHRGDRRQLHLHVEGARDFAVGHGLGLDRHVQAVAEADPDPAAMRAGGRHGIVRRRWAPRSYHSCRC